jgi:hypothetical protein
MKKITCYFENVILVLKNCLCNKHDLRNHQPKINISDLNILGDVSQGTHFFNQ